MTIYESAEEIKTAMADAEIEITDNQLLAVQWNICYQLATMNFHLSNISWSLEKSQQ